MHPLCRINDWQLSFISLYHDSCWYMDKCRIFFSQSFNDDFICFLFFLVPEKKGTKQLLENYLHRTWNKIYLSKRNKCVSEWAGINVWKREFTWGFFWPILTGGVHLSAASLYSNNAYLAQHLLIFIQMYSVK